MEKTKVQCDATNRVDRPAFGDAVFDLVRRTACELPADVEQALRRAHSEETPNSTARRTKRRSSSTRPPCPHRDAVSAGILQRDTPVDDGAG